MPSLLVSEKTFNRLLSGILVNKKLTREIKLFMDRYNYSSFAGEENEDLVKYFLMMWFDPKLDPKTKKLMADFNKLQMEHFKKL